MCLVTLGDHTLSFYCIGHLVGLSRFWTEPAARSSNPDSRLAHLHGIRVRNGPLSFGFGEMAIVRSVTCPLSIEATHDAGSGKKPTKTAIPYDECMGT